MVDDDPETIDASPPAAPDEIPAVTLNASPMLVPEPTEIAMLPPEPDADEPLPISKAPLSPTLAVPVLNHRSHNTPTIPALLVDTATLPELNAAPMLVPEPTEIAMLPPEPDADEPLPISKALLHCSSIRPRFLS
jgi:hypothetical protein